MQFEGAREERLRLPVLHWYGHTEVDFSNSTGVLLGHTASARHDSHTGAIAVTLGKAAMVTCAVLSNTQIVPFSYHARFPGGSPELQPPSCHPVPGEPASREKQGSPNPFLHRLPWLKQSLCLKS